MKLLHKYYMLLFLAIILSLIIIYLGYEYVSILREYEEYKEECFSERIFILSYYILELKTHYELLLIKLENISTTNTYTRVDRELIIIYLADISWLAEGARGVAYLPDLTSLRDSLLDLRESVDEAYRGMLTDDHKVVNTLVKDIDTINSTINTLKAIHNELLNSIKKKSLNTTRIDELSRHLSFLSVKIMNDLERAISSSSSSK
jgi:hypothetical protein